MAEENENEEEVTASAEQEVDTPAAAAETPAKEEAKAEEPAAEERKPEKKERTAEDIFLELEGGAEAEKPKVLKAKGSKNVHAGIVHVSATFNNTIVSVSDLNGNIIGWSSAGKMGFRGSRKSTAYAAQLVSQDACRQAMSHGLRQAEVRVKGPGAGRESAVRAVQALG
ncbi:MAG: 30S ribosomal protein S11, partial [Verrucomicrobiae bacterium]|nr:30S ribosomal protein S11 [Verrucomicrobiae bacterium]